MSRRGCGDTRSNKVRIETQMPLKEYKLGQAFSGVIGRTFDVSQPAWPMPNRARDGAPNVLFIILDDTGFGHRDHLFRGDG